jgi:hypothetical protein
MKKHNTKTVGHSLTFFLCLIVVLITLTLFNVFFFLYAKPKISYVKKDSTNTEISFWQTFLISHPSYQEGWVELAKLNIQKGNKTGAETAFQNAWKIDPNSVEIQTLKNEIEN